MIASMRRHRSAVPSPPSAAEAASEDCPTCGHPAEGVTWRDGVQCSTERDYGFGDSDPCGCKDLSHITVIVAAPRLIV